MLAGGYRPAVPTVFFEFQLPPDSPSLAAILVSITLSGIVSGLFKALCVTVTDAASWRSKALSELTHSYLILEWITRELQEQ
jgi:hypothetical protein